MATLVCRNKPQITKVFFNPHSWMHINERGDYGSFLSTFLCLFRHYTFTHRPTHTHTRTDPWLMCDVVMQNFLRLSTNAESMHMFDLL